MDLVPDPLSEAGEEERDDEDDASRRHCGIEYRRYRSALADGGEGTVANTQFTELPGIVAQAQVPNAPTMRRTASRTARRNPASPERPSCARIWRLQHPVGPRHLVFPPNANAGANS